MATIGELLEKTVPPLGYELVDWDMSPRTRLVRVFIDKPEGSPTKLSVEDCSRVSHHLTHLFAVENIDFERLEVSSPGLDRPLKTRGDYERFRGQEAKFTLREPVDKAKKLKGTLRGIERGVDGDVALVETPAGMRAIPLSGIERARLVPKIEWRRT